MRWITVPFQSDAPFVAFVFHIHASTTLRTDHLLFLHVYGH